MVSSWGGTIVQAWSSPDALKNCPSLDEEEVLVDSLPSISNVPSHVAVPVAEPNLPSVLWNAMIYPMIKMAVAGALWYQGELVAAIA